MHHLSTRRVQVPARPAITDPRWRALDAVVAARTSLGLRDRDIAVLRALLSFLPANRWAGPLMVYASNAVLRDRCDGMDERTLRRRLAHLCDLGLIARRSSPNRKRFVLRDADGDPVLTYGFDLAALRDRIDTLEAAGRQHAAAQHALRLRKAVLRDRLYRLATCDALPPDLSVLITEGRKLLRRNCALSEVDTAIATAQRILDAQADSETISAYGLTVSDRQTDRHIQSSDQDSMTESVDEPAIMPPLALHTCLNAADETMRYAENRPQSWSDLARLAETLAPAIGVGGVLLRRARDTLGPFGSTLAVIGLVQAYPRIREPQRYLAALITRASQAPLDIPRMFRSLTGWARFPAGNPGSALT